MEATTVQKFHKASIIPVSFASWELELAEPFQVARSLSFENAEGLLKPELFDLWRDLVSKRERDELARSKFALVHRFESTGHVGREEADSDDFAFKVFLCLRIIKPTRAAFQRIQVKFLDQGNLEVFSFQHPALPPNIPDSETLNNIDLDDIRKLRELLPAFLRLASKGPENVRRAVRHFNVGYSDVHDPTVQFVIWMMGVEALFTGEQRALSHDELLGHISNAVGLDTDIYEPSPMREYIDNAVKVADVFDDLVTLRNRFAHGQWIPTEWKERIGRSGLGNDPIRYADVLREAASFILRKGILKHLEERNRSETQA